MKSKLSLICPLVKDVCIDLIFFFQKPLKCISGYVLTVNFGKCSGNISFVCLLVLPCFNIRQIWTVRCGRNNSSWNTGPFYPNTRSFLIEPSLWGLLMLFQFLLLITASVRIWMVTNDMSGVKPRSAIWNKLDNSCWKRNGDGYMYLEKIIANSECETDC